MKLVEQRPILGYGFGTEGRVFVDRWYYFASGLPENSSIGILLQLGVVGFALLLGLLGQLLWGCVRALRPGNREMSSLAVLGIGVLAGAVCVTFIQSYIYSVGNLASVTVWVSAFVIGTALLGRGSQGKSIGS
jgi:O-antigen ligase